MTISGAKVDVIVPVHDQRRLVKACLTSVLAARTAIPFELVVVDDASKDMALQAWLAEMAGERRFTLLTNAENIGFTKSVNRGMRLHPERDVLLLNSDTVVWNDWLDRLHQAAYSLPKVASVNPLTNASHIGSYPFRHADGAVAFEVADGDLNRLAAEANAGRCVEVHTTVGFCMYIRRAALDAVGLFDAELFPFGYGEESDFCYRARKVGWRHLIAGDVFVRHWEGQSFGERKARMVAEMVAVFGGLHPDMPLQDRNFAERDPIRPLREALDLARLKLLLAGATSLPCHASDAAAPAIPALIFDSDSSDAELVARGIATLQSLPQFRLPEEVVALNTVLARLGIDTLHFRDGATASRFAERLCTRSHDVGLAAKIRVAALPAMSTGTA